MPSVAEHRSAWVLVAATLALGMLTVDVTVVRVALPAIQGDLDISNATQQWVVNAYLLTLAVFVVAGGRAGDLLGRRRVFLAGLAIFTLASIASGLAPSGGVLVGARAVQGIGAAVMTPGTYSIVTDAFSGRGLGRAIGVLTGTAALGLSIGPLLGGALTEALDWRWIFFINVPLGAAAFAATTAAVPESRDPGAPRIDVRGLIALAVGLTGLTLALLQGQAWGWGSAPTLGALACGAIGLAAFFAVESRVAAPLIELRLLRRRAIAGGNAVGFCAQFVVTGLTVLLAIYLQDVLGNSALLAGLSLLPLTAPVLIGAPLGGRLADRIGPRWPVVGGLGLVAAAVLWVGLVAGERSYAILLPGLVAFGCGFAVMLTAMTAAVMGGAAEGERGLVSGIFNTARNVGATLGVAVTAAILAVVESRRLTDAIDEQGIRDTEAADLEGLLAGADSAQRAVARLPAGEAERVEGIAAEVFADSFAATMRITAAVAAAGAAFALVALAPRHARDRLHRRHHRVRAEVARVS